MMTKTTFFLCPPGAKQSAWRNVALVVASLLLATFLAGCASDSAKTKPANLTLPTGKLSEKARQEQRQAILKVRTRTLNQLHKLKPQTRTEIEQAAGYGVFEINGLNAVLAETHGRGMVQEKRGGRVTYMRLARTDISPGVSVKPYLAGAGVQRSPPTEPVRRHWIALRRLPRSQHQGLQPERKGSIHPG